MATDGARPIATFAPKCSLHLTTLNKCLLAGLPVADSGGGVASHVVRSASRIERSSRQRVSKTSRAKLALGIGALIGGVSLGALNFVFIPRLALFAPIWGLGLMLAFAAVWGFLPAALALVLARRREVPRLVLTALWGLLGLGPGTLLGAWWLEARREAALESAVQHCDAVRMQIESFQHARGRLPRSLDELPSTPERPLLVLTGDVAYHATAEHFEFRINTSRGLGFHGPIFDSRTGSWTR